MTWSFRTFSAVLASAGLLAACGDAARTTETLSGTVAQSSSATHTISVAGEGDLHVTLSNLDPTATVGLGIGQPSDAGCTLLASNAAATSGTNLSLEVEPGSYCVSVYDVGNLSSSATYSLTVTHP